jgi:transcriptional/translational regulatory protein YebC/TACO1
MEIALNAEAGDLQRNGDYYEITCDPGQFPAVVEAFRAAKVELLEAEVKNLPKTFVDVDVDTGKKLMRLIDLFNDNDDVQNVYTNANITAEMAE